MSNLQLITQLQTQGIKHSPESIIEIAKNQEEQIIFLETGNSRSDLQHILEKHEADFLRRGISKDQIPKLVVKVFPVPQLSLGFPRLITKINEFDCLRYLVYCWDEFYCSFA